jgi:hypothetical protein
VLEGEESEQAEAAAGRGQEGEVALGGVYLAGEVGVGATAERVGEQSS